MSEEVSVFQARDAIAYLDLYRRLKVESADYVTKERDKLVDKFWNMKEAPTRYFAELRAHEHALDWILHRKDPGLVVLGEIDEQGELKESKENRELKEELDKCRQDSALLARQIKQFQAAEEEWQAKFIERKQQMKRLERKLNQTHSTFMVVGITLLVVIVIQFGLLLTRP